VVKGGSSVNMVTRLDEGVSFPGRGWDFFVFATASIQAPRPTRLPLQQIYGALSPGVKRSGHEADHSLPSSAEVKNL